MSEFARGDRAENRPGTNYMLPAEVGFPSGGDILLAQYSEGQGQRNSGGGAFRDALQRRFGQTGSPGSASPTESERVDQAPVRQTPPTSLRYPDLTRVPGDVEQPALIPQAPQEITYPQPKPYVSETSKSMNKLFEQVVRGGSYFAWGRFDAMRRGAAIESQIAKIPMVSAGATMDIIQARDEFLTQMRTPFDEAHRDFRALRKFYPADKLHGPNWLDNLTAADRLKAERFLRLNQLKEVLQVQPPNPHAIATDPVFRNGLSKEAWIKADSLDDAARALERSTGKYVNEMHANIERQGAMRRGLHNNILKTAGVLAGAWTTNLVIDNILETDKGPSAVTYITDMVSPLVLLTNKKLPVKFAVMTGSHLVARVYDKLAQD